MSNNDTTATKRIAVTDETWKKLHEMRKPGQTFGQLINLLIMLVETSGEKSISWEDAKKQLGLEHDSEESWVRVGKENIRMMMGDDKK